LLHCWALSHELCILAGFLAKGRKPPGCTRLFEEIPGSEDPGYSSKLRQSIFCSPPLRGGDFVQRRSRSRGRGLVGRAKKQRKEHQIAPIVIAESRVERGQIYVQTRTSRNPSRCMDHSVEGVPARRPESAREPAIAPGAAGTAVTIIHASKPITGP